MPVSRVIALRPHEVVNYVVPVLHESCFSRFYEQYDLTGSLYVNPRALEGQNI